MPEPRIKGKLKQFTTLMDRVCPPATQFAVYNKVTSEKDVVVYLDFVHETLSYCEDMTYMWMYEMFED